MRNEYQAPYMHTGKTGRVLDEPPLAPSRPLKVALMGCGIDRPSVTVSRWITLSERRTQKMEEAEIRREGGREEGEKW